ncbi:hypothetical protein [Streptomyces sp. Root1310]|uniref:hypothetical protein n=1 Tax=Streptomyces sp. Root1310 TaxID=1736452 RepID=UPI0012FEAD93|nr:hypothetical protein [Streptomyces sp. Root1310]
MVNSAGNLGLPPGKMLLGGSSFHLKWRKRIFRIASKMAWPPEDLDERIYRACRWSIRPGGTRQDHYNTACVYAVAMGRLDTANGTVPRAHFADAAIRELQDALSKPESKFHPLQTSWLLSEDPDLIELRRTSIFANFERQIFPNPARSSQRPRFSVPLEMAAYDHRLLVCTAKAMELTWHSRKGKSPDRIQPLIEWLENEQIIWECLYDFARDQARCWLDRKLLVAKTREIAEPGSLAGIDFPPSVPELDDLLRADFMPLTNQRSLTQVDKFPDQLDSLLDSLSHNLSPDSAISPIQRCRELLAELIGEHISGQDSMDGSSMCDICSRYASTWETVYDIFNLTDDDLYLNVALLHLAEPVRPRH